MKKFFLTLGAATLALSSFAATRVLYEQNFETAVDAAATGWEFGGTSMTIASDEFGKFLELSLGNINGRTGVVNWGEEIFLKDGQPILEDGTYTLTFDFCLQAGSNNQYNGCLTIFTNHKGVTNQPYRNPWSPAGYWQNYLFDMSQVVDMPSQFAINGGTIVTEGEDGTKTYAIDYSDPSTLEIGAWYTVTLDVNVNDRTVEWSMNTLAGDIVKSGTLEVPETDVNGDAISMYAEGMWAMLARYNSIYRIDNIKIYFESSSDYANDPVVALTGIGKTADDELNLNLRTYTITFLDGETLHIIGTNGDTEEVEYADCEGQYQYTTTTSGTLTAWTTCGEAESEKVVTEVDCTPVKLPAVTATISSVGEGYEKSYTLTVSNTETPLQPTIFISYEFKGESGETISSTDEASGCIVSVKEPGTLTVTSQAFGYEATEATVKNNVQFETKKAWDFARMAKEEIVACGFPAEFTVLNTGNMSGFNSWSGRKRLYYNLEGSESVNDEGKTVYTAVYPFGFIAEDNTTNVIEYSVIDRSAIATTAKGDYFEGLTIFPDRGKVAEGGLPNVGMIYRVGLYNDQTTNNNNNVVVNDLDKTDFVVVNYINNYGGNSNHPVVATDEDYYAVLAGDNAVYSVAKDGVEIMEGEGDAATGTGLYSVTHALYRIDTAITKITVFKQVGGGSAVEEINAAEIEGDGYYYTIDGIRLSEPTRPGLYIHNGKKIIIKK